MRKEVRAFPNALSDLMSRKVTQRTATTVSTGINEKRRECSGDRDYAQLERRYR
jgi:hypothetical protein